MHGMNYNHAYILIINFHPLMMCDFIQKKKNHDVNLTENKMKISVKASYP